MIMFLIVCFVSYNRKNNIMNMEKIEKSYKKYDLISVKDETTEIKYVSLSYTDNVLYYNFLYKANDTIKHLKIRYDNTKPVIVVIETDTSKPTYIQYGLFYKNKDDKYYTPQMLNETKNVLIIPEGSLVREIKYKGN